MTKNANFSHGGDFFRRFVHLLGRFGAQRRAKKQRSGAVVVFVGWFFCVIKNKNAKHFKINSVVVRKIESRPVRISVVVLFLGLDAFKHVQKRPSISERSTRSIQNPFQMFYVFVSRNTAAERKLQEIASFYCGELDFLTRSKVGGFVIKKKYIIL